MQDAPNPGHHHKELAEPLTHDGRVVQRLAGGHVVVIGHGNEKDDLWTSHYVFQKILNQVATLRDGSPLVQQVSDQFGGCDRGEDAIYEGQVSEKEVHGSWKHGAQGDGGDDEKIGQNGEQENEQKDNEEYFLQVWILCESQENKLSHVVGRCEDIHLGSNTFLCPELSINK